MEEIRIGALGQIEGVLAVLDTVSIISPGCRKIIGKRSSQCREVVIWHRCIFLKVVQRFELVEFESRHIAILEIEVWMSVSETRINQVGILLTATSWTAITLILVVTAR